MSELIKNKQQLIDYLTNKKLCSNHPPKSVFVTSRLRREVMTDDSQCLFRDQGTWKKFAFKSAGGGVYEASISSLKGSESDK